jgi:hypothetical protein
MGFLSLFASTHPQVMSKRISQQNWTFSPNPAKDNHSLKSTILHFIEKKTGWRIGEYRNYTIVKKTTINYK